MRSRTWLIAALLVGSGFCALVYQVGWLREFRLIFGASTTASAAVLAIFIGGLGLGGLLLGRRADRHPRPLLLYAQLELIVAVSAAATPFLLAAVRFVYLASGGSTQLGGTIATIARLVLSAIVLAVPTLAMGGTLPAAARAATRDTDLRRQDVAVLYALNTLGAVVGCFVATFWLIETVGTRSTLWLTAAVNVLVAVLAGLTARFVFPSDVASALSRTEGPQDAPDEGTHVNVGSAPQAVRTRASRHSRIRHPAPGTEHPAQHPAPSTWHQAPVWFLLIASATVGFAFFLMELVWYRLLAPLIGGSVFTFGLVLAIALAGIGAGALLYALVAGDRPASLSGFGLTCLIEAAAVAFTFALGDRVAVLALTLLPLQISGFGAQIAGWTMVTSIVVLPPAVVAGYQFPLLIALFGRGRDEVGRQVGLAYAANTLGAIVGSLAGGFGLLPWLSATGAWQFVAIALLALGATAVVLSAFAAGMVGRSLETGVRPLFLGAQVVLVALTITLVRTTGPTAVWRHSAIGAGRASADVLASTNQLRGWMNVDRRAVVWDADGIESGVALITDPTGYAFILNGKSDGSARGDAGTQVMLGLLGALARPDARRALVIGLGTGSTAGWLVAVPSVDRVDVVELEPLVLEVARASTPVNHEVLANPKVHVTIGDARETLLTTRDRYDVIASEPSNPYRAGVASLFTLEFYRAAADRLTADGVFAQWVQGYEIDAPTLRTIYATLGAVFPQIETWQTNRADFVLVASKRRQTYRARDLAGRIAEEPFKSALAHSWRAVDVQGLLAHFVADDSFARQIARAPDARLNTDDRNIVEFGLARSVGHTMFMLANMRNAARSAGASRPPLEDSGEVRWAEVDTAVVSYDASEGAFLDTRYQGPPNEQARQAALVEYYQHNNVVAARDFWQQQPDPPRDPTEMAMLADIAANSGSDTALPFIDRLRAFQPAEADTILATLRLRQLKLKEAADALEAALTRIRTDPWPMARFKERAIQLAAILASRDSSLARRMFDGLGQPFAVRASEDVRLITRAEMTRQVDFRGLCANAVGALEPHVPWIQNFLRLRRDCYQASNDPQATRAERDLKEYLRNLVQPLVP